MIDTAGKLQNEAGTNANWFIRTVASAERSGADLSKR